MSFSCRYIWFRASWLVVARAWLMSLSAAGSEKLLKLNPGSLIWLECQKANGSGSLPNFSGNKRTSKLRRRMALSVKSLVGTTVRLILMFKARHCAARLSAAHSSWIAGALSATRWSMTFRWDAASMKHCGWWMHCSFLKKTVKFARPTGTKEMQV